MPNKKLLLIFIFFLFATKNSQAADHALMHQQIYHAFNVEAEIGAARDGSEKLFDISGWIGGDYDRLWLRSEKKEYGDYEEQFEVQAAYSRNISQFWDAQIGLAHDFSTDFTSRNVNYFTLGLEGLAPQSFETTAQIFLSDKGNYSARFKQEVDIFITQRLITQPYFEMELFAQDVNELEVKRGISDFEIGILTRYEIERKFAPYFALRYHTKTFATANLAQKLGERVDNFIFAFGIRLRF